MLDATTSGVSERVEEQAPVRKTPRARKSPPQGRGVFGTAVPTPAAAMEAPAVMAAAGFMTPFAMAAEATMLWRRSRCLSMRWMEALSKCRTPQDVIETNARFGEKALALGFSESFRVFERGAMMGRQAAAPASLALRDAE
jgi:hypothetical protein